MDPTNTETSRAGDVTKNLKGAWFSLASSDSLNSSRNSKKTKKYKINKKIRKFIPGVKEGKHITSWPFS